MQIDLKNVLAGIESSGSAQPYLEGFAAELISVGYSELSTRDYVRSAIHLGQWMASRHREIDQLDEETLSQFARHKCRCAFGSRRGRRPSRRYVARARRFVDYLSRLGVVAPLISPAPKVLPTPLVGFRSWMTHHRGLQVQTINRYERLIEKLLPALGSDPAQYDAALVRQVLLRAVKELSRGYAKTYVIALRAFLRFLAVQGRCRPHLDQAVPTLPEWNLSALPRYLEKEDVDRVIASCDLSHPQGMRDRAILLLLARLGLRAGDVRTMRLGDFDWEEGTLRVLGKGRREVRLPLPQDAGEAVIDYIIHARPQTETDRVFLCLNAPIRPLATSSTISDVVRLALQRAGIVNPPSKGAHLLRHSAATGMLRSGASLEVIGSVLRHQSPDSTAYYAKVDTGLLGQIAQPWPEEESC